MADICIPLPIMQENQVVEVEVRVDGKPQRFNYRVELFDWDDATSDQTARVRQLQRRIHEYDQSWELFQIGKPAQRHIPITFRKQLNG